MLCTVADLYKRVVVSEKLIFVISRADRRTHLKLL